MEVKKLFPSFLTNIFKKRKKISKEEDPDSHEGTNEGISINSNANQNGNSQVVALDRPVNGQIKVTFKVNPSYYGRIIGKDGKFIKKIQGDHKVNIQVPKRMEDGTRNSDLITIYGFPSNTELAKAEIGKLICSIETKNK